MLAEFFSWLTTPCLPEARRLGYLREAIALRQRARRCHGAWAPHLQASRDFLVRSAGAEGELGVVLGSGLLLDVPLDVLAARFRRLVLVDMVHLPEVRRVARSYPGVSLLEADVTGVAAPLLALGRQQSPCPLAALEACFQAPPVLPAELQWADWVASVNLFSQLPLLPLAWAERLRPGLEESLLLRWQDHLLSRHLEGLRSWAPRGCLVADALQECQAADRVEVMDYRPWLSVWGVPEASWSWSLAPEGEARDGGRLQHQVAAWRWAP